MSANGINVYQCDTCHGEIVTIDRIDGVTPFMMACRATNACSGIMRSSFYRVDQALRPEWEWYRPASMKGLDDWTRDHVSKGGLVIQRIPPNTYNINDPLLRRCVEFIQGLEHVSAITLQRQFRITYMTAARIMDEMSHRRFIDKKKDKLGRHLVLKKES